MAVTQVKRSTPAAQPKRRRLNPHLRLRAYETLFHLNRGFTLIVLNLDRLERLAIFERNKLRAYRNMSEEVRALANTTLLATIRQTEYEDAGRLQKLRFKWEQRPFPRVPNKPLPKK